MKFIVLEKFTVQGLILIRDFISIEREKKLVGSIDRKEWKTDLSRRVQHYGYSYNYKNQSVTKICPLINRINKISKRINKMFHDEENSNNQCIVNEYTRTQGIGAHTDSSNFDSIIYGLSLLNDTTMVFSKNGFDDVRIFLPRRSLLIMKSNARYQWKHEILKNVTYTDDKGNLINKNSDYRRISITYRTVKENN